MKFMYTSFESSYAGSELRQSLLDHFSGAMDVVRRVVRQYPQKEGVLLLSFACPCCHMASDINFREFLKRGYIIVSAFPGIDRNGLAITVVDKYPPNKDSTGQYNTTVTREYFAALEIAVKNAIENH